MGKEIFVLLEAARKAANEYLWGGYRLFPSNFDAGRSHYK